MNEAQRTSPAAVLRLGLTVLAIGIALPGLAAAQERIHEVRELRPDASVEIQVVSHDVRVERWDRNEIEVTGSYDPDREELEIRGTASNFRLQIRVPGRGGWSRRGSAELRIRVPEGVRLELASVSGSHEVRGLTGDVSARSVSGTANVEGSLRSVTLETVSGNVRFRGEAESVRANTVSGQVDLEGGAARVSAQSVSGGVDVRSRTPAERLDFNSVSGEVRFAGPLARLGTLRAESHSGRVTLALAGQIDARVEMTTFSGRLEHDLDGVRNEERYRPRWGPGEELSFEIGEGTGRIDVKSFSGSVRIGREGR